MQSVRRSYTLFRGLTPALALAFLLPSCADSGPGGGTKSGGTGGGVAGSGSGGTTGSGGSTGSGGTTGTGGSTAAGGAGSGGRTGSGGSSGSGGAATGGASAGGASGGGGTARTGGATGSGGVAGGGGAVASGGATGRGGAAGGGGAAGQGGGAGGGGTTGSGGDTGATGGTTGTGGKTTCEPPTVTPSGSNWVADGPLITFNANGGWCWYQDERAVVDAKGGKLVVGSVAFPSGDIQAVIYDLNTRSEKGPSPAKLGNLGSGKQDDHNAPAVIVRPDGRYAAMWAGHNHDCNSYFSTYDGTKWSAQGKYDWNAQQCASWSRSITYSNMWYLGTDLVSFVRSVDTSPNYLISKDNGASWSFGGRLTSTPTVGYVAGYYKYWGNNTDRIDFLGTEAHPRDNNNSLYHGYVKDGKIYNSTGTVVDQTLADKSAQDITKYTQVFKTGATVGSVKLDHAWNADLVRYDDGVVAAIWTARVAGTGSDDPDKRLLYARFDGSAWKLTHLARAGTKLYRDEQDYTGLGALHPDDPTTVYISTPYDPSTDTLKSGAKREIWRGTTCDNGATFTWTPVTANSSDNNYRPIVPKWDAQHTALLWMRGEYRTAQDMTMAIVGTITGPK